MEIALNKKEFLDELNLVQGVVDRRHPMPILSNMLIQAKKEGILFFATDLDVGFISTVKGEVRKEGEALVPAKILYDAINLAQTENVRLKKTDKDGGIKVVMDGGIEYKLVGGEVADFPKVPKAEETKEKAPVNSETLKEMIRLTSFASGRETGRYTMSGTLIQFEKNSFKMVTTDSYRLAITEKKDSVKGLKDTHSVIISQKGIREIERLIDRSKDSKEIVFSRRENQLFFTCGPRIVVVRMLEENFPEFERVVPKDNDKAIRFGREKLLHAVKSTAIVLPDQSRYLQFEFSPNMLLVSAEESETGQAKYEMSISYVGEDFKIRFNWQYLIDFLSALSTDDVLISMKGEFDQVLFEPVYEKDKPLDYKYILMPMRPHS